MLTAQQLEFRRGGLGGSDVGAVLGVNPDKRPIDVYRDKIEPPEPLPPTDAMHFGNLLEPLVADEYGRRHAALIAGPFDTRRVESRPWHLYSIDRVVLGGPSLITGEFGRAQLRQGYFPPTDEIERILEIKTAGRGRAWTFGDDGSDDLPPSILVQCAWYLAATSVNTCTVAALLNTNDYREYVVERDLALEGAILEGAERFWRLVETRTEPEPDGSKRFSEYLKTRYSKTTGLVLQANPDQAALVAELRTLKARAREIKARSTLIEQHLKVAIGDADAMETPDGKLSYRFDRQGHANYKAMTHRLIERYEVPAHEVDELLEEYRGAPPRKFNTPRAWASDAPTT